KFRLVYPNEERFNPENFGDCPLIIAEQALSAISQRDLELADLHATPVALVGQWFAASKGSKEADPNWFNPFGEFLYRKNARDLIPPQAAQEFLALTKHGKVPSWVLEVVDVKLIRAAAK
ncbi:MAG TPA: hypothetical protein V6C65_18480, partial [Allocoleopsis sp.]